MMARLRRFCGVAHINRRSAGDRIVLAAIDVTEPVAGRRIAALDVLRGAAIVGMVVYHFAWDLWVFGFIETDVGYGFWWRLFAHSIASTFLVIVGISLVLAARRGFRSDAFLRRLGMVAGGAVLVTIATWFTDARTFVFFGILHMIAAGSVLAVPFITLPVWVTAGAAAAVIALGNVVMTPVFNPPWLVWIGLSTEVPATVDFYPVFPWFGAILAGIAIGRLFVGSEAEAALARWYPAGAATRLLELAGRWSLVIYLVHQLILFSGVSLAASYLLPRPAQLPAVPDAAALFMDECLPSCGGQGQSVAVCTSYCACMFAGINGTDLQTTPATLLTAEQRTRLRGRAGQCAAAVPPSGPRTVP
jgi:uncharacterized membrane protein